LFGPNGRPSLAETVVCYDSPHGFNHSFGLAESNKKTLIVHSPSGNYNNSGKAGAVLRFMPVPPLKELKAVGALEGISELEVQARYNRYGPSLRFLINPRYAEASIMIGVSTTVSRGVDGLVDLSPAQREVIVLMQQTEVEKFLYYSFVSDFVRDLVIRELADKSVDRLLTLANTVDVHGSLRGQVFENRMIDALGRTCTIEFDTMSVPLAPSAPSAPYAAPAPSVASATRKAAAALAPVRKVLEIAGEGVTLKSLEAASALPAGHSKLLPRVLYIAPTMITKSWDALLVDDRDNVAYLLQTTVAKNHPVKYSGLKAGTALLRALQFNGEVRLVFLVPPTAFPIFKLPQTIENADKTESVSGDKWPQEKWCVQKIADKDYWPVPQFK
jgi:hypothetical protein